MKPKKIPTNKIGKKTFFELAYPTYSDTQEHEINSRSYRKAVQMYRLDLEMIEKEIVSEEEFIYDLIANREEDWKQDVATARSHISDLHDKSLLIENEGSELVDDFKLELVIKHLRGWNYADSTGQKPANASEALSLPSDIEEFKALGLDQRIVRSMIEEVQALYNGEEEKNG